MLTEMTVKGIVMAIVKVVKYDGRPDVFAWKFPHEELGTWTQLIVNESQEAVLFKGGQALDVFGPGRHTLETGNIPLLNKIINLPFGGKSPFKAEVWYINRLHSLDIKWGTSVPIQLQDPKYKVFLPLRAFGQFGIQIDQSKQFLTKLVGTMPTFDQSSVTNLFKGLYLTKVKDAISTYLVKKDVSMLEINAYLLELSAHLQERIAPEFEEYGIRLINFFVKNVNVPEDDPAVMQLKAALSKRAEMDIIGFNYTQERSFDTLEGAATNPGSGQAGLMGAGIGMGMGFGIGGQMGNQMGQLTQEMNLGGGAPAPSAERAADIIKCSGCGHDCASNRRFCTECGTALSKSCPGCNEPIARKDAKFCPECGESLQKKCGECGAQVEGDPKFCPECGNKF